MEDNIIPLANPDEVEDEFTSDDYEEGYRVGIDMLNDINKHVEARLGELFPNNDYEEDFADGVYDAIVENFNI